jgi:hypothetical protein
VLERRIGMRLSVAVVLILFGSMVDAQTPTSAPVLSTSGPTLSPVTAVTSSPTSVPVVATPPPTEALQETSIPTIAPITDSPIAPSSRPTNAPTNTPSQSPSVSFEPSISAGPSTVPTLSAQPSQEPTDSQRPSAHPSAKPSLSLSPSEEPSPTPSDIPSSVPTQGPSAFPTVSVPFFKKDRFRQEFVIPASRFFTTTEEVEIGTLFASYTDTFAPNSVQVVTNCIVVDQNIKNTVRPAARLRRFLRRLQTNVFVNEMDYTCEYLSSVTNVTNFPDLFLLYMNSNLVDVALDMQGLGLNVTSVLGASLIQVQTPSPTVSRQPSEAPTARPSISSAPSSMPSALASNSPSMFVTTSIPTRVETTFPPSLAPVTSSPTMVVTTDSSNTSLIVIIVVVVLAGVAILAGLFIFYRRRTRPREEEVTASRPPKDNRQIDTPGTWNAVMAPSGDTGHGVHAMVSPSESLLTSKSLLSAGSGMSVESGDEGDNTKNLQDEFDQYKDQNLEQLRSDVEGNLTGFEGIMSAAVTRALMGGEVPRVDDSDLMWGAQGPQTGAEIEASALCDVNDWLKRNESATVERRRVFMQEMLNRMVSSVRFGVIEANDASLTIHESAALLGLQLANELPMTTVIISGMRKTVSSSHIVKALREFGEIDVAAVASGQRGFGIVRFRNPKSATLAIRRYRSGEIVVQDVAVQMQVLTPSGAVEGRLAGRRS